MRICLLASEVAPFSKTGGLADVSAALTRHLARRGHDVRLVTPLYPRVRAAARLEPSGLGSVVVPFPGRAMPFELETARLPQSEALVHFVHCPPLFGREAIYTHDPDEPLRFALLTRAGLALCQHQGWAPDVVHANDWHTALAPLYLRTLYAWDRLFEHTRTLLTIHNIGYQGLFGADVLDAVGLGGSREQVPQEDLRAGVFNFLKAGVVHAGGLSTVSRTYAREIQTPEYGAGLHELLARRSERLVGIVNGVDYHDWDPRHDPALPAHYGPGDLAGKALCKRALCEELGLDGDPSALLLGIVSRLTWQKGCEILPDALTPLLRQENVRLAVLGSGEEAYESSLLWLAESFPGQVAFRAGYDEGLAHRIEAGSDAFLMPSRYEPCGLNQMYSLRYGSVPVVRRTGGLADTVAAFDPRSGTGTGFVFDELSPRALLEILREVLATWRDRAAWSGLVERGMRVDFSWERQVLEYEELYRRLLDR